VPQYAPEAADDMPAFDFLAELHRRHHAGLEHRAGHRDAFTRATPAWVRDHEARIRQVKSGELRLWGWRREENLAVTAARRISATPPGRRAESRSASTTRPSRQPRANGEITQATRSRAAGRRRLSAALPHHARERAPDSIQVRMGATYTTIAVGATSASFTAPVAAGPDRHAYLGPANRHERRRVKVEYAGLHDVSGRANQNPPEEVSVGVADLAHLPRRRRRRREGLQPPEWQRGREQRHHGWAGALISRTILKDAFVEPFATTNRIAAPRDLTNAAWTKIELHRGAHDRRWTVARTRHPASRPR
jgi:hypothetical protein